MNIEKLERDLMIRLNDSERGFIKNKSKNFLFHVALLNKVDTQGVQPMTYPNMDVRSRLREDTVDHVITQELAFENAPKTHDDYIEIVQVIDK